MDTRVKTVEEVFGERLEALRKRAGLSQKQLAERVAVHGGSMHQTTIMRTEKGERHVTLNEFVLLSAALSVPPLLLLLPLGAEDLVEITPRSRISPHLALEWFAGEAPLVDSQHNAVDVERWERAAEPIRLHRALRVAQDAVQAANSERRHAEYLGEEQALRDARQALIGALHDLGAVLREWSRAGLRAPQMPKEWTDQMDALGIAYTKFATPLELKRFVEEAGGQARYVPHKGEGDA